MTQLELFTTKKPPKIVLLDYQCTLCSNGYGRGKWFNDPATKNRPFSEWIAQEKMRNWMIPLLFGKRVIMITARKTRWENVTLTQIKKETGWLPDEWYFNPDEATPPEHKFRILKEKVFPRHGTPQQTSYIALESNSMTRQMYADNNIFAIRIDATIPSLPLV